MHNDFLIEHIKLEKFMKKTSILMFLVLLFLMSYWTVRMAWGGSSFLFFIIVLSGFFTPFFIKKEKVVQMILPLVFVSSLYGLLSICVWGVMNQREGIPFFVADEYVAILLFFILSFIGGLIGIVISGILKKIPFLKNNFRVY